VRSRKTILVLHLAGQYPLAGVVWQALQYLIGLGQLGYDVYYVEDSGAPPYDPRVKSKVADPTYNVANLRQTLERFGFGERWGLGYETQYLVWTLSCSTPDVVRESRRHSQSLWCDVAPSRTSEELHMAAYDIIVVLGLLGRYPLAGIAWQLIHHLVGLQHLGFKVYYIEDTGTAPYDPRIRSLVGDCTYSLHFIANTLQRIGMEHAWAYRDGLVGQWYGLAEGQVQSLFGNARCVINLCGASDPATLAFQPKGKFLYLETDPVINQVRITQGDEDVLRSLTAHDAHATYGANLGETDCPIPLSHFDWKKTRPPVVLDCWPFCPDATCPKFTTITTWHNHGKDLSFRGERYYWSKHLNFLALIDLPQRAAQQIEIATDIEKDEVRRNLHQHGWLCRDALSVSQDLRAYQEFISTSRGEFTVSKDLVVRTKSGWFSDRSACYLAAGKPVVTQETGFSKFIPTGQGLFAFSTVDEAVAALETINTDYMHHAHVAREIAAEYFAADKVLRKLLQDVGVD
jgi:hypothetical protein